jgi:hypothetical protein
MINPPAAAAIWHSRSATGLKRSRVVSDCLYFIFTPILSLAVLVLAPISPSASEALETMLVRGEVNATPVLLKGLVASLRVLMLLEAPLWA